MQLANQQAAGRRFVAKVAQQSGLGDFFATASSKGPVEEPSLPGAVVEPLNVGDKRRKNSVDEKITDEPDTIEFLTKQPSVIQGTMRPYQLAGLNWMIRRQVSIINRLKWHPGGRDGSGQDATVDTRCLGTSSKRAWSDKGSKTTWSWYFEDNIIANQRGRVGWQNEFARWLPSLKVLKLHATTKDERSATGAGAPPRASGPGGLTYG